MKKPNNQKKLLVSAKRSLDVSVFVGNSLFWEDFDVLTS